MKPLRTSSLLLLIIFLMPLICLAQRSSFFPGSTEEYSKPLYFDVLGAGVEAEPLLLSYSLTEEALTMGPLKMRPDDFYVNMVTLRKANTSVTEEAFVVQWPDNFMRAGLLEFISRTGKVLWSVDIDEKALDSWKASLAGWKTSAQYGLRNVAAANNPIAGIEEPFRVCLTKSTTEGHTRLCSAQFRVETVNKKSRVFKIPFSKQPPRVILNNEQASLAQEIAVKLGAPVQFYAELTDGSSFEFYAIPQKIKLVDMTGNAERTEAAAIFEGEPPLQNAVLINKEKSSRFFEFIGWQQTIGDFRTYWRTKLPYGETQVMIQGDGGGAFLQRLRIEKLPQESMRPYMSPDAIEGTYVDGSKLYLRKSPDTKVSSTQNSVEIEDHESDEFIWSFGAKKSAKMNRSYLNISKGADSFRAYHELFKGYPRELSLRSTALGSAQKQTIIGEVAFAYWLEDIWGWRNPHFSKQRWGLNARYFRSVGELTVGSLTAPFQATTLQLKYRLTPGMWARKETWGLIGAYESVQYSGKRSVSNTSVSPATTVYLDTDFSADLLGVGFFWARSMPRVFDNIFNYFPFMNYPKWVDAELIYYPTSVSSSAEVSQGAIGAGNFALNFHGQVMWSDRFFGEAGFGLKQYDYVKTVTGLSGTARSKFAFASLYGTVGLGYRF